MKDVRCLFQGQRNAVQIRSGPATVIGDERSRSANALTAIASSKKGEKALQVRGSESQETIPGTREPSRKGLHGVPVFLTFPNSTFHVLSGLTEKIRSERPRSP
jgi:hypothetical protein